MTSEGWPRISYLCDAALALVIDGNTRASATTVTSRTTTKAVRGMTLRDRPCRDFLTACATVNPVLPPTLESQRRSGHACGSSSAAIGGASRANRAALIGIIGKFERQHLDRHGTIEARVASPCARRQGTEKGRPERQVASYEPRDFLLMTPASPQELKGNLVLTTVIS
jgi:hypothetical protein